MFHCDALGWDKGRPQAVRWRPLKPSDQATSGSEADLICISNESAYFK
jgi:hypothetical protein